MLSQHTNNRDPENSNEDANKTPTPTPTSLNQGVTASTDDIEESVTLHAPATPARTCSQPMRRREPPPNAEVEEILGNRRLQRIRKPVNLFQPVTKRALVAQTNEEPTTLADALASPDATEWQRAWDSEVKLLEANGTWVL